MLPHKSLFNTIHTDHEKKLFSIIIWKQCRLLKIKYNYNNKKLQKCKFKRLFILYILETQTLRVVLIRASLLQNKTIIHNFFRALKPEQNGQHWRECNKFKGLANGKIFIFLSSTSPHYRLLHALHLRMSVCLCRCLVSQNPTAL